MKDLPTSSKVVVIGGGIVGGAVVVGRQQQAFLCLGEAIVAGQPAQIEQRAAKAGIFPVDQPKAVRPFQDVAGQKVVVTQNHIDRADGRLQRGGLIQKAGQQRQVGRSVVGQLAGIVAQDVEHPEAQDRPGQVPRRIDVDPPQQGCQRFDHAGCGDIPGGYGQSLDELRNQNAWAGMADGRRKARSHRRPCHHQFVPAQDSVFGNVLPEADDIFAARIGDQEVLVGLAAFQQTRRARIGPARQGQHPSQDVIIHRAYPCPRRFAPRAFWHACGKANIKSTYGNMKST